MCDENPLVCPYCDDEQYCHEPDEISAHMCYTECEHCGKSFWYAVEVKRKYDSWKDDSQEQEASNG